MRLLSSTATALVVATAAFCEPDIQKVRVGVVARITEQQSEQFRMTMSQLNPRVDESFSPKGLEETDAIVFIMNS